MMKELTYANALELFGLTPDNPITLNDLEIRYAKWRREETGASTVKKRLMDGAFEILASDVLIAAWKTIPPSQMTVHDALAIYGHKHSEYSIRKPDELAFEPPSVVVRKMFLEHKVWQCPTLEKAMKLDQAYRILYDYPFNPRLNIEKAPLEPHVRYSSRKSWIVKMRRGGITANPTRTILSGSLTNKS
jgi:hypothetical protein